MSNRFTFGSLFSGIGGVDLGLESAGMRCEWQVEKDEYCTKVLQKHWPDVTRYGDIRTVNTRTLAPVDLIAGGFPCQPHSLAGKRQASADERDLWSEFARVIRELRPVWILAENVVGILSSEDGDFFGKVLRDLAQMGYDAEWGVLSAEQFGAPHLRERVFVVAHSASTGSQEWTGATRISAEPSSPNTRTLSYTDRSGWQEQYAAPIAEGQGHTPWVTSDPGMQGQFEPDLGRSTNGVSSRLDRCHWPAGPGGQQHEWEPPRTVTTRAPNQAKRLKALGNAVVPDCAEWAGRRILESIG